MTPTELVAEIDDRLNRATEAIRMGQAAAISTVVKVKAPGVQVSGKGTNFRFVGAGSPKVAKTVLEKAQESAALAMKRVLND